MIPSPPAGFSRSLVRALHCLVIAALLFSAQPARGQGPGQPEAPFVEDEILIRFKAGAKGQSSILASLAAVAQPSPELNKVGVQVLKVPRGTVLETVAALRQNSQIEFAEPNYLVFAADAITPTIPNDPYWGNQWGPPDIQAPLAWSVTTGTASVTIAIIDTGVDLTHPDLADKIDLVNSTSFVTYTTSPQDDNGHGTHVAGIAAATSNNGVGIAGMAWGARIMALKILNSAGTGSNDNLAAAIYYAVGHGARIINLSLGDTAYSTTVEQAVNDAYASGVTVVAAAGNSGTFGVLYPAAYPNAIAVASVDSANNRSYFSNYGPSIALAAPGSSIYSTMWPGYNRWCPGSSYCSLSGTSMATPHVAGTAALLASLPQFDTPDKIRAALQNTARDLGDPGRDPYYGFGLVQAYAALSFAYHVAITPTTAFRFSPAGSVATYLLAVSNTGIITDSYTVTLTSGVNFTATVVPASIDTLGPAATFPVTLTVAIPNLAPLGAADVDRVTITSQADPTVQVTATLTTVVPYTYRLLPIFR